MKPFVPALLFTLIVSLAVAAAPDPKWEQQVASLEASHQGIPTPDGAVLFIGSSSIRGWKSLAKDFPELPVINHGFGGSQTSDAVAYFERLVLPYRPALVVFYAGTNDLAAGKTPETVAADFRAFCEKLHAALPQAKILYLGLVMAPARWELREKMALTNTLVAAFCAADARRRFVDLNPFMMTPEGEPRRELYIKDQLHLNRSGYEVWRDALRPLLH